MILPSGAWIWFVATRGGGAFTPSPAAIAVITPFLSEVFVTPSLFDFCGGGPAEAGTTGVLGGLLTTGTDRLLFRRGEMAANGEAIIVEAGV